MSGRMIGRNPLHNASIGRSVGWTLRQNWKQVKPCPRCDRRVYANYAGDVCKKCRSKELLDGRGSHGVKDTDSFLVDLVRGSHYHIATCPVTALPRANYTELPYGEIKTLKSHRGQPFEEHGCARQRRCPICGEMSDFTHIGKHSIGEWRTHGRALAVKSTMDKACPNLIFEGIDTTNNKLVVTPEGWKFWEHTDPVGRKTNVQFCKLIGRKRDVFECINESEWKRCTNKAYLTEGISD